MIWSKPLLVALGGAARYTLALAGAAAALSCKEAPAAPFYQKVAVSRRDIVVSATADGSVLPLDSTEVKSKASGEVIAMLVQTGDEVRKGQLLVQIDPRNLRNAVTQAQAELDAATAQLETAQSQFVRAEALHESQSISDQDYENAKLQVANGKNAVTRAQVALENAQIAFDDANVKAPSDGVVLQKNVEEGTVISSATTVIGGTVLLKIADVDTMEVRALVDETDIGRVAPGQRVSVTVDAYPNRSFAGRVLKIEPQSVVQQNVVLFPVLAKIPNPGHLLKSGMSCEIEIHVSQRRSVLAVPKAALRRGRDVESAAGILGLTAEDIQRQLTTPASGAGVDTAATPYSVFVLRDGEPWVVRIQTGLGSLNDVEVTSGLTEADTVLLLPSASLVASQENLRERAQRLGGAALPGVQQRQSVPVAPQKGRPRTPAERP